mmetsp:Transcript_46548/g.129660  ORF Transcript_46548/g.129660 Transcript_46548/m.129660 type:complete len:261 (+) Transcript_46548:1054-1836(+)
MKRFMRNGEREHANPLPPAEAPPRSLSLSLSRPAGAPCHQHASIWRAAPQALPARPRACFAMRCAARHECAASLLWALMVCFSACRAFSRSFITSARTPSAPSARSSFPIWASAYLVSRRISASDRASFSAALDACIAIAAPRLASSAAEAAEAPWARLPRCSATGRPRWRAARASSSTRSASRMRLFSVRAAPSSTSVPSCSECTRSRRTALSSWIRRRSRDCAEASALPWPRCLAACSRFAFSMESLAWRLRSTLSSS